MKSFDDLELSRDEHDDQQEAGAGTSDESTIAQPEQASAADQSCAPPEGESTSAGDGSVLDIIADVEANLQRVRNLQASHDAQLATLQDRAERINSDERDLADRAAQLEAQDEASQRAQAEERERLERDRGSLDEEVAQSRVHVESLDQRAADLDEDRASFQGQQDELGRQQEEMNTQRRLLDEHWEEFNHERARLSEQEESLTQRGVDMDAQGQALREETEAHRTAAETAERETSEARDEIGRLQERVAEIDPLRTRADEAEAEVARRRDAAAAADEELTALHAEQAELNERVAEIDPLRARADEAEAEVARRRDAAAAADEELNALRTEQNELKKRVARAEEDEHRAAEAEAEASRLRDAVADTEQRVAQAEGNVGDLIRELEASQEALSQRVEAHQRTRARRDGAVGRIKELEEDLAAANGRTEQAENEALSMLEDIERERDEARRDSDAARAEVQGFHDDIRRYEDELEKTRVEASQALCEAEQHLIEQHHGELSERDRVITERDETLEKARTKLARFSKAIAGQTDQLERGALAIATVQEQDGEIERLKEQLTHANVGADPQEMTRRDERIAELTEALHEARGQTANTQDLAEREQRIETLAAESDALRHELERARIEADSAQQSLAAERDRDHAPDGGTAVAERDQRIEILSTETEELRAELDQARGESDRAQRALAEAQEREGSLAAESGEALAERGRELETLRGQVESMQSELSSAEARAEEAETAVVSADGACDEDLSAKVERIRAVAAHLHRRKSRLARVRTLLSERQPRESAAATKKREAEAAQSYEVRARQMEQLRMQREGVQEAIRCLTESERVMIRRWARPRAVVTLMWLFILAGMLAAGSWFATLKFFPATIAATVEIEAQERPGFPMTAEQARDWQIWHEGRLEDESFLKRAADRFDRRGAVNLGTADQLAARLDGQLSIDSIKDGQLALTLTGLNGDETQMVLDTIAVTLVSEARRQAGSRTDGARTALKGERKENGGTRYATLSDVPVRDDRLTHAGYIFGGAFMVALLLCGLVYRRLSKARRVFDEGEVAFAVDSTPPTIAA